MKKTMVFVLTVAMVLTLLPSTALAATQQNVPALIDSITFDGNVMVVPASNGSEILIQNCKFTNGAYIYIDNCNGVNVTIKNCTFSGAIDGSYNYACTIINAGNVTIENNTVYGSYRAFNVSIYSPASKLTMTGNKIALTAIEDPVLAEKNIGIQVNGGNWVGENIKIENNTFENATTAFRLHNSFAFVTGHEDDVINLGTNTCTNCKNYIGRDPDVGTDDQAVNKALGNIAYNSYNNVTPVTAAVNPSYTIVIPPSVNFGTLVKNNNTVERTFNVAAQNLIIDNGAKVQVMVASDFNMKNGTDAAAAKLAYSLFNQATGGTALATGAEFASFTADGTHDGRAEVNTNAITAAGSYQGTMVFTISYVPAPTTATP